MPGSNKEMARKCNIYENLLKLLNCCFYLSIILINSFQNISFVQKSKTDNTKEYILFVINNFEVNIHNFKFWQKKYIVIKGLKKNILILKEIWKIISFGYLL